MITAWSSDQAVLFSTINRTLNREVPLLVRTIPSPGFVYGSCMVCVWFLYQSIQKQYRNFTGNIAKPGSW